MARIWPGLEPALLAAEAVAGVRAGSRAKASLGSLRVRHLVRRNYGPTHCGRHSRSPHPGAYASVGVPRRELYGRPTSSTTLAPHIRLVVTHFTSVAPQPISARRTVLATTRDATCKTWPGKAFPFPARDRRRRPFSPLSVPHRGGTSTTDTRSSRFCDTEAGPSSPLPPARWQWR